MLFLIQTLYQHIIYINFLILLNLWMKHMVHQPLISCPRVLQPKGHHLVTKQALTDDEGCLLLIRLIYPYLVITREGIHET